MSKMSPVSTSMGTYLLKSDDCTPAQYLPSHNITITNFVYKCIILSFRIACYNNIKTMVGIIYETRDPKFEDPPTTQVRAHYTGVMIII